MRSSLVLLVAALASCRSIQDVQHATFAAALNDHTCTWQAGCALSLRTLETLDLRLRGGGVEQSTAEVPNHAEMPDTNQQPEPEQENDPKQEQEPCSTDTDLSQKGGGSLGGPCRHVIGAPRPPDSLTPARIVALDAELAKLGVEARELLEDAAHDNSPARKAYGSFVSPRGRGREGPLAPLPLSAARAALQILFLHRQHNAMRAAFLRSCDAARASPGGRVRVTLVLDNLRSVYNVGSIFRTAETAGCWEVVTCGVTAHPPHPKLKKTAFSAHDDVATRHVGSTLAAVRELQAAGVTVLAMETTSRSKSYASLSFPQEAGVALVLGNEVTGVDTRVMSACDDIIQIPTFGKKNSLNVAAACPVVVFEVLRQWGKLA